MTNKKQTDVTLENETKFLITAQQVSKWGKTTTNKVLSMMSETELIKTNFLNDEIKNLNHITAQLNKTTNFQPWTLN